MQKFSFDDFRQQGSEIDALKKQIIEHRLVHAVLITGQPGAGKRSLAGLIATSLMCSSEGDIPCGECDGCRLALAGEHPDITVIEKGNPISPDVQKGRATIPVEDIREMIRLCSRYAYGGGNRVVMIPDAENMTPQAQNSLLKILEEPPRNTFFLMTTGHPEQILTTVRSRCRNIKLIPWDENYIKTILVSSGVEQGIAEKTARVSGGSIGNAIRLSSDDTYWKLKDEIVKAFFENRKRSEVLNISTTWKDRKGLSDQLFDILEDTVRQFLKYRLFRDRKDYPEDYSKEWQRFAETAPLERFALLTDSITSARKQNASNVNFQAIIEQLLLTFIGECELWAE